MKSIDLIPNLVSGTSIITINKLNCLITKGKGCHVYSSYSLPKNKKIYVEVMAKSATYHIDRNWFAITLAIANVNYTKYVECYFAPINNYIVKQKCCGVDTTQDIEYATSLKIADVIGLYIDISNKIIEIYINNNKITTIMLEADILNEALHLSVSNGSIVADNEVEFNFGESAFKYPILDNCISFYQAINSKKLYKKDNEIYGMQNSIFTKLADGWIVLKDSEKVALFVSTNYETATVTDLKTLGKFKTLMYSETEMQQSLSITAAKRDQIILPRSLIDITKFEGIDKAIITSSMPINSAVKIIVTTDLTAYLTYDFETQTWQIIDHTDSSAIESSGIDTTNLANIPRAAWDTLMANKAGIGFAYLLGIESTANVCNVDKLQLQVDMKGKWNMLTRN